MADYEQLAAAIREAACAVHVDAEAAAEANSPELPFLSAMASTLMRVADALNEEQ